MKKSRLLFTGAEQDLLRQLGEKDRSLENVRNEHDKQIANFRAENFDLLKLRQKLEIDASGLKLELDNCKQIHSADNKRLEEEIRGLKSRLSSTQDSLGGCRQECLNLAEVWNFKCLSHTLKIYSSLNRIK